MDTDTIRPNFILRGISLKNFRCHRKLKLEFQEGITGITGDNGKGKSSVTEAILFLLTGKGYGDKSEMLTVGESSGYVVGQFEIDGKEATLERHLDTSKVLLQYDGKTYKKSSEVDELWDRLFQIDRHLVRNVVIAQQGEIAALFSGDNATKEKTFQKIFMVPNTSRIRDVIWTDYIKKSPPLLATEDPVELRSALQCSELSLQLSKEKLDSITKPSEESITSLRIRKKYLEECISSEEETKLVKLNLADSKDVLINLKIKKDNVSKKLESADISEISQYIESLKRAKKTQLRINELERTIAEIDIKSIEFSDGKGKELSELETLCAQLYAKESINVGSLTQLQSKLDEYERKGVTKGVCPTCGTSLKDLSGLVEHTKEEMVRLKETLCGIREELAKAEKSRNVLKSAKEVYEKTKSIVEPKKQELAILKEEQSGGVEYQDETLELYQKAYDKYQSLVTKKDELQGAISEYENRVKHLEISLAKLVTYDNKYTSAESELTNVSGQLTLLEETKETYRKLEVEIALVSQQLNQEKERYEINEDRLKSNKVKEEYTSILNTIYDILHTSKFPRLLIQTYASTVTEYMNNVLEQFDFPYSVSVNSQFSLDVCNAEGLKLPSVSGGQAVMLGLSLRIALHDMFGGAFPFMLIDEGSYGLATKAKKSYFEVIRKLKGLTKFKQIFIIDHDEELNDVVDNIVSL